MDINSLLSPSDSPRTTPAPNNVDTPPKKTRRARAASNASASYDLNSTTSIPTPYAPNTLIEEGASQPQNAGSIPGAMAVAQGFRTQAAVTPPTDGFRSSRQPSTPGMDALADLASMQHHQQAARANARGLRNTEIYDSKVKATGNLPAIAAIPRSQTTAQILRGTSFDRTMVDAPTQTPPPRQYATSSLSDTEQETVTRLAAQIVANPFAYDAHVQLITIVHRGLLNHEDPREYDLLTNLQADREGMGSRFALGEDLLADWVQDQILLTDTLEAGISVMELCQKTVEEEPSSTRLWHIYGTWILSLYKNANCHDERLAEIGPALSMQTWSEEDRIQAQHIFTWPIVMDVWRRGSQETRLMINDSNQLWDTYMQLRLLELDALPSRDGFADLKMEFQKRLHLPHATWDQTFQAYSTFINQYDTQHYEDSMITVKSDTVEARKKYEEREYRELGLLRALQANDQAAELRAFLEYIDFETGLNRQRDRFDFDLLDALYQRATLRFPANTELWEAYVMFYNEELTVHGRKDISAMQVLEQATRHCPWSGNLWAQYLLAAEIEKLPFANIGQIKHKATRTGLLDAGSMDEILKVHTAWCGFLRRRAFQEGASDEDADVAEVGIRSAIEDMETAGRTKYGKDFQGDPEYRLEKIYIKYLTQGRQWAAARDAWRKLARRKGDSHDYWLRYYRWEMATWCKLTYNEKDPNGAKFIKPTEATKVLQQALKQPKLDWPEKIIETFRYHCEDHEDAAEFQSAIVRISKAERAVKRRRETEAYEAYEAAQAEAFQQQREQQRADQMDNLAPIEENGVGKRKREDNSHGGPSKRSREDLDHAEPQVSDQDQSAPTILKRDRENAIVIVKNLPVTTTETRVRQFFRDCGTINSLKLLEEANSKSATASIEFESEEDVLTSQTKDMKAFDGNVIEIQVGRGSTIYVCNFPPTADEKWIREKFQRFGEIVDIRFPSLKYNTHRRFCYIQFKFASQAQAATQLDGEDQGDDLKLLAKISDPTHKQSRQGAMYEGREIYLANLNWGVTEKDIKQVFKKYGYIESVRIPRKINGGSKGMGFVVFRDKQAAEAALEMNLTTFHNRILNVTVSTNDKSKRIALPPSPGISQRASNSPAPNHNAPNGDTHNAASPTSTTSLPTKNNSARRTEIASRTHALLNIPDTVNDARIRALCAPYGELISVRLRPDHGGAIIEYKDVASVGRASLGLEGYEIAPGRLLTIGSVAHLNKAPSEFRSDKLGDQPRITTTTQNLQSANPIRRPGQPQPGARRGGRGGLGSRRINTGGGAGDGIGNGDDAGHETAPKSNAEFRDMLLKK